MAQAVVDVPEVIQVHEEHGDGGVISTGSFQHLSDPIEYEGPIGQSGQRIVERRIVQLVGMQSNQRLCSGPTGILRIDDERHNHDESQTGENYDQRAATHGDPATGGRPDPSDGSTVVEVRRSTCSERCHYANQ